MNCIRAMRLTFDVIMEIKIQKGETSFLAFSSILAMATCSILGLLLLFSSCKTPIQKDGQLVENVTATENNGGDSLTKAHLIVSFFSRGAGIDYNAYKNLLLAINEHNAMNKTTLVFSSNNWGREGEKDLCFPVQNTPNFDAFIAKVKMELDSNQNVHLLYNEVCRNTK